MTKAILKNGVFEPAGPLPSDWSEGTEVEVEKSLRNPDTTTTDEWMNDVERSAQESDPDDADLLREAIAEIRSQAKELARQGRM